MKFWSILIIGDNIDFDIFVILPAVGDVSEDFYFFL